MTIFFILCIPLFLFIVLINSWLLSAFLLFLYPFVWVFSKNRNNLIKPIFMFNANHLIGYYLSNDWNYQKNKEIYDNTYSMIWWRDEKNEKITNISLEIIDPIVRVFNYKIASESFFINNRFVFIINPFSHRKIINFFKNAPTKKEDRVIENRNNNIDQLLK